MLIKTIMLCATTFIFGNSLDALAEDLPIEEDPSVKHERLVYVHYDDETKKQLVILPLNDTPEDYPWKTIEPVLHTFIPDERSKKPLQNP